MSETKSRELSGVLFRNEKALTEKHPMYKGQALVDGVEYWLAGWLNTHKERGKYLSIKFERKDAEAQAAAKPAPLTPKKIAAEDIPF